MDFYKKVASVMAVFAIDFLLNEGDSEELYHKMGFMAIFFAIEIFFKKAQIYGEIQLICIGSLYFGQMFFKVMISFTVMQNLRLKQEWGDKAQEKLKNKWMIQTQLKNDGNLRLIKKSEAKDMPSMDDQIYEPYLITNTMILRYSDKPAPQSLTQVIKQAL